MDGQQPFQRINDAYVLDWVSTINPTTVLNVRASYNRFIEKGFGRDNDKFDLTSLGLPLARQPAALARLLRPLEPERRQPLGRGQSINITNNYSITGT
jgi:hypothetical protein